MSDGELEALRARWDDLGRDDPFWAVLTDADKRGGTWDADEFFRTGREEIGTVLADVSRLGLEPGRGAALDFGCGLGRLVQALAGHFDEVTGVDIAASMIERAEALNAHGDRCRYVVNEQPDLRPFADGSFDFVYSCRVLQHMEPQLAKRYLTEFVRVLRPGGAAVFQVPSRTRSTPKGLLIRYGPPVIVNRLRKMEMHGIPPADVVAVLAGARAHVVDRAEDDSAGGNWESFRYTAVRSSPSTWA
jgi:SAM-dependent methyltransferase